MSKPTFEGVIAYYFDEGHMTRGELFGWLTEALNEDVARLAPIREMLRARDMDVALRFDKWLRNMKPDTEIYHHREMFGIAPELLEAIKQMV